MSKNTNIADLINYISVDGSGNVVLTTGGQVATQSYVTTAVSNLVNSAPSTLDTLNELATALGNDANFATTVTTSIATKLPLAGGTLTGALSGTSATFVVNQNSTITNSFQNTNTASTSSRNILNITAGNATLQLQSIHGDNVYISPTTAIDTYLGYNNSLRLASTGAATFSSSVTAAGSIFIGTNFAQLLPITALNSQFLTGSYYDGSNVIATAASGTRTIYNSGGFDFRNFTVATIGSSVTDTSRMVITSGGNVGIATSNPASKLSLGGAISQASPLTYTPSEARQGFFNSYYSNSEGAFPQYLDIVSYGQPDGTNGGGVIRFLTNPVTSSSAAVERMRITSGGNIGIGTITPSDKLQVVGSLRWGSATNNLVSFADGGGVYMELSAPNSSTRNLRIQGINNAGNKYSAIRLEAGIEEIAFVTADVERMRISSPGDLYLYNGSIQQQGVWTVFNSGFTDGTSSFNFDIGVGDEGGGGNIFKVEAGFAHFSGMAYNCLAEFYISTRSTGSEITDVIRRDTSLAGSFTAWKTTSTVLRINKSAGTYPGGGRYWIKVTKVNY